MPLGELNTSVAPGWAVLSAQPVSPAAAVDWVLKTLAENVLEAFSLSVQVASVMVAPTPSTRHPARMARTRVKTLGRVRARWLVIARLRSRRQRGRGERP